MARKRKRTKRKKIRRKIKGRGYFSINTTLTITAEKENKEVDSLIDMILHMQAEILSKRLRKSSRG